MKAFLIGLAAIIVLGGGSYLAFHKSSNKAPATTSSSQSTPSASQSAADQSSNANTNQNSANTITYTNSGFSPATLTVKAGTTVTIKNTSSHVIQFDSDPHPAHTDDTQLNVGLIEAGQSATFTPTKTGDFGYHNHLDPSETGHIIVE